MAIITREVVGSSSRFSANVYSQWNQLEPPNRRCYWKAYCSNGSPITFPSKLTGYKTCDLVIEASQSSSTYNGFSGSKIRFDIDIAGVFSNSGSVTLKNVVPRDALYCAFFGEGHTFEITNLNLDDDVLIERLIWTGNAKYVYTFEVGDPTIENLTVQGNFWEREINVNWRAENQAGYEYELYYDNVKVKGSTGTTAKAFTIPANTFTGTLPASVRVRTYNVDNDGTKYYSEWEERVISLKDIEATISNLLVTGECWEEDIVLSWQSTDQQQLKVEVWKDNILQNTYTGTTATRYTVPKNTLTSGTYLFKVWVGYANRFVNNQSKNVTLKNITPTVDDISLSGSNIDYSLILSWVSTYQSKAILEIYKGDSKVNTINLTTEKSYTIANNTLTSGSYTFKIKVAYTAIDGDRWTDFKQLNTTLVESLPSIGALQPDGVILDKNSPIKAWWTSQNQSKYTIEVVGSGYKYTGTTEKEHIIPQGTLQVGTYTIKLTVTYVTGAEVEKSIVKESKFIVTGKPNTPTITSNQMFSYNRPVITWDSAEQLGFICIVEDLLGNEVWSSDWQNGLITRIKCMNYLSNGDYIVKVQIMNEFSIKSDFAIQQFTVNATETVEIALSVEDISFGKKLIWTNEDAHYQAFYIVRDSEVIAKTDKLEYFDYSCRHGESEYTVRGVTGNDTYNDSNSVISTLKLPHSTLATVSMSYNCINSEIQRDSHSTDMSHDISSTVIYLNGRENPVVVVGEHITEEHSINFVSKDYQKFISMCDRRETFIHRDRRGNVTYLSITNPSLKVDKFGGIYSAKGLKVDYKEVINYD